MLQLKNRTSLPLQLENVQCPTVNLESITERFKVYQIEFDKKLCCMTHLVKLFKQTLLVNVFETVNIRIYLII